MYFVGRSDLPGCSICSQSTSLTPGGLGGRGGGGPTLEMPTRHHPIAAPSGFLTVPYVLRVKTPFLSVPPWAAQIPACSGMKVTKASASGCPFHDTLPET